MSTAIFYEEEANGLRLVEYEEVKLGSPSYMVLGLPDTGLVGVIASNHLVESLGMREVGGIDFLGTMPPVAVISQGAVRTPLRIYRKDNILVVSAETPIPGTHVYPVAGFLVDYAQRRGVDYIVSIVGVAAPNRLDIPKPRVYWIASDDAAKKLVDGLEAEMFANGFLVGPYAVVLKQSIRRRVSNLVLLAEAYIDFPDPEAAAEVVKLVSKIIGVEVNVSKLLDQAEMIRLRLRGLMKQTKQSLSEMKAPSPLMYA